jgi:hypothetical protein
VASVWFSYPPEKDYMIRSFGRRSKRILVPPPLFHPEKQDAWSPDTVNWPSYGRIPRSARSAPGTRTEARGNCSFQLTKQALISTLTAAVGRWMTEGATIGDPTGVHEPDFAGRPEKLLGFPHSVSVRR